MSEGMTRRDREDLVRLCRLREKVTKAALKGRVAEVMADFAKELSTRRKIDDARWKEITAAAEAAVASADGQIAAICRQSGVPEAFRPSISLGWASRGENADAHRRAELKYVAATRCAAMLKTGEAEIERRSIEVQTQIVAGGLQTEEARRFLESMPTVEQLMPSLSLTEIEGAVPVRQLGWRSEYTAERELGNWHYKTQKLLAEMTK